MAMEECTDLPPGFRFHPTDEEIITHYLSSKATNQSFAAAAIGEVDLNKCEPWDLPSKAKMGEKEWYFFCQRDRKYPTGMRTNRATEAGYWKATGKDKEIFRPAAGTGRRNSSNILVGMKKTLVFYTGRAPKGEKTNWVMHEYRLQLSSPFFSNLPKPLKDEWVVCRVFHKNNGVAKRSPPMASGMGSYRDLMDPTTLPPLMDYSRPSSSNYYFDNNTGNNMDPSYFSTMAPLDDFSTIMAQTPLPIPYSTVDKGDMQQDYQAALRQCKVEQFANQSMVSEDTGLSTDRNTEISSVVSWHDAANDDLVSASASAETGLDLDNMWKC